MKRVVQTIILLFIFYYVFQLIFTFFDKGYEINYTKNIDNVEIKIKEVYSANQKNEKDNYYFEIIIDDNEFYFKTYENFKKKKNIIANLKYIKTETYACIFPIFDGGKILTDIICQDDKITTYYYNIRGIDTRIDEFANSIQEYNINDWIDQETETTNLGNVFVYKNNLISDLYLGLTSYKGLYSINDKVSKNVIDIPVFKNDIYNPRISTQIDNYYFVADYNENYEFTKFYLINLLNKEITTIYSKNKISFNSYIQGTVESSVYLIDIDNKKQYEVDIKSKKIIEIGNENIGVKFYNAGIWENKNVFETVKNQDKFIYQQINETEFYKDYYKIDKIGGLKSGYYYLYEKTSTGYNVYKAYVEQPNKPIFLFKVDNIDNIKYINDSILFVESNFVKIYDINNSIKKLVKYDELSFNTNLHIYGYYEA